MKIKKSLLLGGIGLALISGLSFVLTACSAGNTTLYQSNLINIKSGDNSFLKFSTRNKQDGVVNPETNIDFIKMAEGALKDPQTAQELSKSTVENVIMNFFANINNSVAYTDKYNKWIEDINTEWDDTVKNLQDQYGSSWEYYIQTTVLNPVGGNKDDWIRSKIISKASTEFDSMFSRGSYISVLKKDKDGNFYGDNKNITFDDLFKKEGSVWKDWAAGSPINIGFAPDVESNDKLNSRDAAFADLQSFVFDEYVKTEMPLMTSMTLFKQSFNPGAYFDQNKIANLLGSESDPIGAEASYKWQTFPNGTKISQEGLQNTTDKYNNFIEDYGTKGEKAIQTDIGGAININVKYTDDSSTLYPIKLNDVFTSSFTPYAAAATYKFNKDVLGVSADKIPTAAELAKGLTIDNVNLNAGTEIISNFMSKTPKEGYFNIPQDIQNIMIDGPTATNGFVAKYSGVKSIADIVELTGTPYMLARNSAGVHIIGIDRLEALTAVKADREKLVQEIKNTLLWRHVIAQNGFATNTGLTSYDLNSEISSFYSANRNEILYKYILKKSEELLAAPEANKETVKNSFIFSDKYTATKWKNGEPIDKNSTDGDGIYINPNLKIYLETYFDYQTYKFYSSSAENVTNKILDSQTTYTNQWWTNSVINNGIAGTLPFTWEYSKPNEYNTGIMIYNSLLLRLYDGTAYDYYKQDVEATKKDVFEKAAGVYLTTLGTLDYKDMTFAKKWVEIILLKAGPDIPLSNKLYSSPMDAINQSISTIIASEMKSYVQASKTLAEIDDRIFDEKKLTNNQYRLAGYNETMPAPGTTEFINSNLEYAMSLIDRNTAVTSGTASYKYGDWSTKGEMDKLNNIGFNLWNSSLTHDPYSTENITYYKNILGLQYALDWDSKTGQYNFTKFRDYLLRATDNDTKAAYVWNVSDYKNAFSETTPYGKTVAQDFKFKNPVKLTGLVNGYAFQGQTPLALTDGYYDGATTTLTSQTTNYFNVIPNLQTGGQPYTGFTGMQFQSSNSLTSEQSKSLFTDRIQIVDNPATPTYKFQGTLYNLGEKSKLVDAIKNIRNYGQIYNVRDWLASQFNADVSPINDEINKEGATVTKVVDVIVTMINDTTIISNEDFTRISSGQIANSAVVKTNPNDGKFFGNVDGVDVGQMVATQFNYQDVVKLFDTDSDNEITDKDKGINWTVAAAEGFLGSSSQAFFHSIYTWFKADQTFSSIAYNDMLKVQNNVDMEKLPDETEAEFNERKIIALKVYDRRLNNLFGESWVWDFKKEVTENPEKK